MNPEENAANFKIRRPGRGGRGKATRGFTKKETVGKRGGDGGGSNW